MQLKFNIFSLNLVPWNPYWPLPVITDPDPQPKQPLYWQDSQDPYELGEDFDSEDFYVNQLRQGLKKSRLNPPTSPMDQDNPSHEQILSHNKWLESLGYDFSLEANNSHLNLSDDD